jgi:glycosyltransferase involved in cell wall biosynthesis
MEPPKSPTGRSGLRLGVDGRVLDDRYHGIGRITYELLDRLTLSGRFDVILFVGRGQRSGRFDIDRIGRRQGVRLVHFDHALTSVGQFLRWPAALRRCRIDVALFPYHLGASMLGADRRFAIVHDCILEADRRFAPDTRTRSLYRLLTRVVIRRTRIITPSRASAAALLAFYGLTVPDSRVLPWGVDTSFAGASEDLSVVAGVRLPERYYLHVGARRPHKNVQQLVRVLAGLAEPDMLILVGSPDGRWPDPTLDLARELGVAHRILAFGHVTEPELTALYRRARAFLYPSLIEGFGLPLLEAMAAGVPVVASDIPVFREVADGAAAFVPPTDTGAWVSAIRELDEPGRRAALIDAGHRRAAAATWDRAADRLASILIDG